MKIMVYGEHKCDRCKEKKPGTELRLQWRNGRYLCDDCNAYKIMHYDDKMCYECGTALLRSDCESCYACGSDWIGYMGQLTDEAIIERWRRGGLAIAVYVEDGKLVWQPGTMMQRVIELE